MNQLHQKSQFVKSTLSHYFIEGILQLREIIEKLINLNFSYILS